MSRVVINLEALQFNLTRISRLMENHGSTWTVVTKALCGHAETLRALEMLGVQSIADSRLDNLKVIDEIVPDMERWYLRPPAPSAVEGVVRFADVSLNSEVEVIEALNEEAIRQDKTHGVIIMIELGDLREGILPGSLSHFYERIFKLSNIKVLGIGGQMGCLAGAVPSIDQIMQLVLYRELLDIKYGRPLPLISAGSSVALTLLVEDQPIPPQLNHFRIGEALFLGTDLVSGGTLQGLRNDVVTVEAEVAEIKEKSLVPMGEIGVHTPFEATNGASETPSPGERGFRALVNIGQLDTEVSGLKPVEPDHQIAGASSDIAVVNLGKDPGHLQVGDRIRFRPDYSAFVRLMGSRYVEKLVSPPLAAFRDTLPKKEEIQVAPTVSQDEKTSNNEKAPFSLVNTASG